MVLWVSHWVASVVVPQILMAPLAGPLHIGTEEASRRLEILFLALLFGVALGVGASADIIDPGSGRVARKAWIIPTAIFALAICSELFTVGRPWIVDEFLLHVPGSPGGGPEVGYVVFTFYGVVFGRPKARNISA